MPRRRGAESGKPRRSARPHRQPSPGLDIGGVSFPGRLRSVIFLVPRCGLRPFLVAHTSLRQRGFQRECFWEVCRTQHSLASPASFWPPRSLQLDFSRSFSVTHTLQGIPILRQIRQGLIIVCFRQGGEGWRFQAMVA